MSVRSYATPNGELNVIVQDTAANFEVCHADDGVPLFTAPHAIRPWLDDLVAVYSRGQHAGRIEGRRDAKRAIRRALVSAED